MLRAPVKLGTVTIAGGTAVSTSIFIPVAHAILAVQFPSTWTGADLGFQISRDGGIVNWMDVLDPNRVVGTSQLAVTPNFLRINGVPTSAASFGLTAYPFHETGIGQLVRFTSINVGSNAAVNQGAASPADDRVLTVWVGRVD